MKRSILKYDRKAQPFNSPVLYRDWSRILDRQWLPYLSGNEFAVVRFIFDRTAGWGKEWEKIPLRHFTDGVIAKDGQTYGKTTLSDKTVRTMLSALTDRGVILCRREAGDSASYSLNYEWTPIMKIPKRLKENAEKELATPVNFTTPLRQDLPKPPVNFTDHKREERKSLREREATAIADAITVESGTRIETREELEAGIAKATAASRSRRELKKQEGYHMRGKDGGFVPSVEAMRKLWVDLHNKHSPQIPPSALPDKSIHMLRSYCREWNGRNVGKEWVDFLEWVFENWSGICRTSLRWMTSKPDAPMPAMVASSKLRVHLENGWQHREKIAAIYALPPREREIRFLMLERGITKEHAESMVRTRAQATDAMAVVVAERENLEIEKARLEGERMADARARLARDKADVMKSKVKRRLDAMSDNEEDELIVLIHTSLGKRRRESGGLTARKPTRTDVAEEAPLSFPAWDDLD